MKSFFDKLTPAERRLVVIVGIAVFVVINIWFVFPMFGQYGKFEKKRADLLKLIATYKTEIARKSAYEKLIKELSSLGGEVATEQQALKLLDEVNNMAALTGLNATSIGSLARTSQYGKTNAFFEEASVSVRFNSGEKELIDFLYRLADKEFLVRAKSMDVQPDVPGRMRLQGNVTLVKSYQRKPAPKAVPATPKTAPSTNTAAKPAPKTPPPPKTTPAPTNAPVAPPKK